MVSTLSECVIIAERALEEAFRVRVVLAKFAAQHDLHQGTRDRAKCAEISYSAFHTTEEWHGT